jgi:hypothetical protein
MQESGTYQLILEEGAVKCAREILLALGEDRLGKPTDKQKNKVNTLEDIARLRQMTLAVHTAKSWDALLRVKCACRAKKQV